MPDLQDVTTDQQPDGFAVRVQVDRDAATRLGVSMQSVQDTLDDAFGQRQISTIFSQSNQYRGGAGGDAGLAGRTRTRCCACGCR